MSPSEAKAKDVEIERLLEEVDTLHEEVDVLVDYVLEVRGLIKDIYDRGGISNELWHRIKSEVNDE